MRFVLGLETSCDDCSASVLDLKAGKIVSLATTSQNQVHLPYGGIVPELASRQHLVDFTKTIEFALRDARIKPKNLDAIAVTNRPGLMGSLLVGVIAAKTLAYLEEIPLLPVHHIEAHIASLFLKNNGEIDWDSAPFPLLVAVVSGGHSQLHMLDSKPKTWKDDFLKTSLIARSLDDAVGEAFDKIAKRLGFPYPGGPFIDRHSAGGDPKAFAFPSPIPARKDAFSFSGLKTAAIGQIEKLEAKGLLDTQLRNFCASIQFALVDHLCKKITMNLKDARTVGIAGGVAANSELRRRTSEFTGRGISVLQSPLAYCSDNAAMVAVAGVRRFQRRESISRSHFLKLGAYASAEY